MTLRELWLMAHGRQRAWRLIAVGAAWLQSGTKSAGQINEYIERGDLGDGREDIEPYNQDTVKALVNGGTR